MVAIKRTPVAAKKAPAKKPATKAADPNKEVVDLVISMIGAKELDNYLLQFDAAVTARIAAWEGEKADAKKSAASPAPAQTKATSIAKPPARKVSASKDAATVKPEVGKSYKVNSRIKKVGGAKVKFVRFYKGDETKAVIEMLVDKPEFPKGKKFPIPVNALENIRTVATSK